MCLMWSDYFFKPGTTIYLLFVLIIILSVDLHLNYWLLFFFLHEMGSLDRIIQSKRISPDVEEETVLCQ